jgi:hypothetical protein
MDERLIERLLDEQDEGSEPEDEALDDDECLVWYLEESLSDAGSEASCADFANCDAVAWNEAYEVNMRVLNDYLQRRISDDADDPIVPTMH